VQHEPNPIPEEFTLTSETLVKALPYMREFAGATFVVKYGGHAMGDEALSQKFARDMVLMKQVGINPIVVHGGGPQIAEMLERLKIQSSFIDGLRVTDRETVDIVEMVLAGRINKSIVSAINAVGGQAVGLCGKDANLIRAEKLRRRRRDPESNIEQILDLGFVGEPVEVDPSILNLFDHSEAIPVIAPIGIGSKGETYNINADTAAGAIAEATRAEKLLMMTDVAGVLNDSKELVTHMAIPEARKLIKSGTIHGGMIPKVETCIHAVEQGVQAAHILDGRIPHVVLVEIFTEHGVGTMLTV
jgi:acetylglutamate kinase